MKNQANMTYPKETNKAPVTNSKEIKIYKLPDKKNINIYLKETQQAIGEHRWTTQ